jgi:hypothetical protein
VGVIDELMQRMTAIARIFSARLQAQLRDAGQG